MVKIKIGNILEAKENIIIHQVNVQGIMGGGVARQLALQYPNLEKEYSEFCKLHNNNFKELQGQVFKTMINGKFIMNMFSQEENFNTNYDAMREGLKEIKQYAIDTIVDDVFLYNYCECGRHTVDKIKFCPMCGRKLEKFIKNDFDYIVKGGNNNEVC